MTTKYGWESSYFAAAFETDWTIMLERITAAESTIAKRQLVFLADHGGNPEECVAIASALVALNVLRGEVEERQTIREDYSNEEWFSLYRDALTELTQSLMAGRVLEARVAIITRIEKLQDMPGLHPDERLAIADAKSGLRSLEAEDNRLAASKQFEIGQAAFEKLQQFGEGIKRLQSK
jgi:hypothetical protein